MQRAVTSLRLSLKLKASTPNSPNEPSLWQQPGADESLRMRPSSSSLSAVVVAAGDSRRFRESLGSSNRPSDNFKSKALIDLNGQPLILSTLQALLCLPLNEIALVVSEASRLAFADILESAHLKSPITLVSGGARRQDSVRLGLEALRPTDRVCIHDGARPFLSRDFLWRLDQASLRTDAVIPALKLVDTIKEIDENGFVAKTHPRSRLIRVQTPQFFKRTVILSAHQRYASSNEEFTDDASMLESIGGKVLSIEGDASNIKVTTVSDLPYDLRKAETPTL